MLLQAQHRHKPVAPPTPPATVQASTDVQKIFIGQPIRLTLEATVPENVDFTWPEIDSLAHFEQLDSGKFDTVVLPGARTYRESITFTSWDSGSWAIPRLSFLAGGKKVLTDSIRILVDYTKDSTKDFHDIKDIVEVPNPFEKYFGWIVAGFTLISLVLVVWLVRKKKLLKTWIPRGEVVRLSPYEEALQQLDQLQKQQLPEAGKFKTHYSRLGEILREYLLRRLGISTHAETSEELIGEIRRHELLPPVLYDALAEGLRMSDFVKFAKYQPGISESGQHYDAVRGAIEAMEQRARGEEERRRSEGQENRGDRGGAGSTGVQGNPGSQGGPGDKAIPEPLEGARPKDRH
ncbi:MAG TPA: hypothetical protein VGQ51_05505 [Puia sp.]|jgi:hypothetical protein|nr:hypothetical protein [Puia sp.]